MKSGEAFERAARREGEGETALSPDSAGAGVRDSV